MSLSREQLLALRPSFPTKSVSVPEFGEGVEMTVRAVSLGQQSKLAEMSGKDGQLTAFRTTLIAMALVDDDGNLLFDESKRDDLAVIAGWPVAVTERITGVINKLSDADTEPDVAVKDAEGNS